MKAANLSLAAGITILMLPGILRTAEPELVTLSAEGEAKMVIAIPEGSEPIRKTAIQLQDMLRRISGADFEITTEAKSGPAIRLQIAKHPLSPPAAPVQGRLQGPPAKSKFLAASDHLGPRRCLHPTPATLLRPTFELESPGLLNPNR
jgi:hypothetical protein